MKHNEYLLQKQICQLLSFQYPNLLFLSDTVASVKLSIPQQMRNKAIQNSSFKCPDLLILKPNNNHCGLFLELKTKSPFKRNGEILLNEHLIAQHKSINELNDLGYYAAFVWSFDMAKDIIIKYLKNEI